LTFLRARGNSLESSERFHAGSHSTPATCRSSRASRILNGTTIRSLKPPATGRVDYFDDLTPGLSLRVTAKNARTWTGFSETRIVDRNA
jgi:hypothetical protein